MPGSGAAKRKQADALRAYRASQEGMTHREIAELIGTKPDQVKSAIERGERIASLNESDKGA